MRKRVVGILIVAAIAPAACSSPPPASPPPRYGQMNYDEVRKLATSDPGWQAWIDAAAEAQRAYHLIVDTPIQQLQSDSSEVGDIVTRARDKYRRARSFGISNILLESGCRWTYSDAENAQDEVSGDVALIRGMYLVYEYRRVGRREEGCRVAEGSIEGVGSSRDLWIFRASFVHNDVFEFVGDFEEIVASDQVSIPDLIATIKR